MRLKSYLLEAIIKPDRKELQLFRKTFEKHVKAHDRRKHKNVASIYETLQRVANELSKKISDLTVKIETRAQIGGVQGSARAGFEDGEPHHMLKIFYFVDDAYSIWTKGSVKDILNDWYDSFFAPTLEHELVHIEQYRKLARAKHPRDVVRVLNQIHDRKDKIALETGRDVDGYLQSHLEIMAHAKGVDKELADYYPAMQVIEMLKTDDGQDELSLDSESFDSYYTHMKDNYPKTWKKFIKYLVQYLQKRAKKEPPFTKSDRMIDKYVDVKPSHDVEPKSDGKTSSGGWELA